MSLPENYVLRYPISFMRIIREETDKPFTINSLASINYMDFNPNPKELRKEITEWCDGANCYILRFGANTKYGFTIRDCMTFCPIKWTKELEETDTLEKDLGFFQAFEELSYAEKSENNPQPAENVDWDGKTLDELVEDDFDWVRYDDEYGRD